PERLDGSRYTVQSDIWSLGISLVELAIGRYPIPFPSQSYIDDVMNQNPLTLRTKRLNEQPAMAIFELLGYIFNADPPQLPSRYFSKAFRDFVNVCLKKKASERTNLRWLQELEFTKQLCECDQQLEVAQWVKNVKSLEIAEASEFHL
ncbi:hypothetical protein GJ496_006343, partial [Pomphorhynchus laevis]